MLALQALCLPSLLPSLRLTYLTSSERAQRYDDTPAAQTVSDFELSAISISASPQLIYSVYGFFLLGGGG